MRWRLPSQVIFFADELVIVQHVQLFARGQLLPADQAGEAVEVEHLLARLADQV